MFVSRIGLLLSVATVVMAVKMMESFFATTSPLWIEFS